MSSDVLYGVHEILDQAVSEYHPTHAFCMFSGGSDSLVTTHIAINHLSNYADLQVGVVHINTGIGVEKTRQFVRSVCEDYGWKLVEYKTPEHVYDGLCERYGFPGPPSHRYMYIMLKERKIYQLMKDYRVQVKGGRTGPRRNRILLITGVRKQESRRRMGSVEPIQVHQAQVWVAPLLNWSKDDLLNYKQGHNLPNNEVVDVLHMSGECMCGSFAQEGELELLEVFYPETALRIHQLQERVHAAGWSWNWGDIPPQVRTSKKKSKASIATLCSSCDGRAEKRENGE